MIKNLFSLPIYLDNLSENIDIQALEADLRQDLGSASMDKSPLEHNGGKSTYASNADLHKKPIMSKLNDIILEKTKIYHEIMDYDSGLTPVIDQCWSNIHHEGSFTSVHSHSLMPIVATFYVNAYPGCGELIFTNPMEYALTHYPYKVDIEDKIYTRVEVKTGDLILFPGVIRHSTGENYSGHDRIVLSYNFRFEGQYLDGRATFPQSFFDSETEALYNKIENQQKIIDHLKSNLRNNDGEI